MFQRGRIERPLTDNMRNKTLYLNYISTYMKLCHETSQLVSWIYSKLERFSHYKCIKFVLFLSLGPTLELETEQDFRPASKNDT